MADLLLFKEENKLCLKFELEEGALHKYCINRFKHRTSGKIYYLCANSMNYGDSEYWISDMLKHDDHQSEQSCWRCLMLARVFKAQRLFLEYCTELLKDGSIRSVFRDHLAASSLFGGFPKILFEDLIFINDWKSDWQEA